MNKTPYPADGPRDCRNPVPSMPAASTESHCAFCGAPLAADHAHLLNPASQQFTCACGPCAVLIGAEKGSPYLRVVQEVHRLDNCHLADPEWDTLTAPSGLAILVRDAHDRILAIQHISIESPSGDSAEDSGAPAATERRVPPDLWRSLVDAHPSLRALQPEVEALLIHRLGPEPECFLVPRAEANRLAALLQQNWRGLSGGIDLWRAVARFFDDVRRRSACPQARCA